jgi:hypothetical protein
MIAPGEIKRNNVNPRILAHFYLGHKNLDGIFMCNVGLFYIEYIIISECTNQLLYILINFTGLKLIIYYFYYYYYYYYQYDQFTNSLVWISYNAKTLLSIWRLKNIL